MDKILENKWQRLLSLLSSYPSAIVAYSGGVDSGLLAYAVHLTLEKRMLAVTVESGLDAPEQITLARQFAAQSGIPFRLLSFPALQNEQIVRNSPERCYFCKIAILTALHKLAAQEGYAVVLEGQNADDLCAYRPGKKAVLETKTLSPLAEQQFSKREIRQIAHHFNLSIGELPSSPCLATRIPYGKSITTEALRQIEEGESFLKRKGFSMIRVRHYDDTARIEVAPHELTQFISLREEVLDVFKKLGFRFVTLDIDGYRCGSMDG